MERREFLTRAAVLMAAGGVWRFPQQGPAEFGPGPAFAPWRRWNDESQEGALGLVRAAVLSANAFNSQPWLFHVGGSSIDVYADVGRNLGAFDPYSRELFFSLGCALENLATTAPANGYEASWRAVPHALEPIPAAPRPVLAARVTLRPRPAATSALFDAIPHRHTNRHAFDVARALPPDVVAALAAASVGDPAVRVFLFSDEAPRRALADLIWDTSQRFEADEDVRRGIRPWIRTTAAEWLRLRDGTYAGPPTPAAPAPSPLPYHDLMLTGRLFGVITVRDRYDRAQTMRAGRVWQRLHLTATVHGLAARPANGAVEIIDHERRLGRPPKTTTAIAEITRHADWQPTFMFYMGYPTVAAVASPRRAIGDVTR